jgi:hypothetical protein
MLIKDISIHTTDDRFRVKVHTIQFVHSLPEIQLPDGPMRRLSAKHGETILPEVHFNGGLCKAYW